MVSLKVTLHSSAILRWISNEYADKIENLRERAREAISKYRDDKGLTVRNQDRLRQDIKPSKASSLEKRHNILKVGS